MRIVTLDEQSKKNIMSDLLKRDPNNYTEYEDTVQAIVDDVRKRKDTALFEYTAKFDKASLDASTIPRDGCRDSGGTFPCRSESSGRDEEIHEEHP